MKSVALARQLQRINSLIDNTRDASGDRLELQAHWGRYLCVLVAGFLENAIAEIYSEYARRSANEPVSKYVSSVILSIQNPKAKRFIDTANAFNSDWGDKLSLFLDENGRKDAVDAIMANRHLIAHGRDAGITVARVRDYLQKSVEVIEFLEAQCGL
jgi:hypothetical protein